MDNNVALVRGIDFFMTGVWPLISMRTFLKVTGPKTDLWLVKTVGLILAVIGAVLVYAQMTTTINPPVILLAIGAALSLTLVEFIYVYKRVISPIYLGDAFAELILIAWWAIDLLSACKGNYLLDRPVCFVLWGEDVGASLDKELGAFSWAPSSTAIPNR